MEEFTNCCVDDENIKNQMLPAAFNTRRQIIKNFSVFCIAMYLVFIPDCAIFTLESTMNQHGGTGVAALGIYYGANAVSSFLLSKYVVSKVGCKISLEISMIGFLSFIVAHFYFTWSVLVPTAIINGISYSILWNAIGVYVNQLVHNYCCLVQKERKEYLGIAVISLQNDGTEETGKDRNLPRKCQKNKEMKQMPNFEKHKKNENNNFNADRSEIPKQLSCSSFKINPLENSLNQSNDHNYQLTKNIYKAHNQTLNVQNGAYCTCNEGITQLDNNHALICNQTCPEFKKLESWMTALFFGIFEFFFRSADTVGNLISYFTLQVGITNKDIFTNDNCTCGLYFCNKNPSCLEHNLAEPDQKGKNLMTYIFAGMVVLSTILIFLFLDKLEKVKESVTFSLDLFYSMCKFIRKNNALLLIPLTFSVGLLDGFYNADYTKSYTACSWGVQHVSLVTISYGTFSGISSPLAGWLVRYTGRIAVIICGCLTALAGCIFSVVWTPNPNETWLFFVGAALWGTSLGILSSQVKAFYGVLFKEDETAYATCWIWMSLAYCVSFAYTNYLCTYIKIYILLTTLLIGIVCYIKVELVN